MSKIKPSAHTPPLTGQSAGHVDFDGSQVLTEHAVGQ